jgi:hypothetical protein
MHKLQASSAAFKEKGSKIHIYPKQERARNLSPKFVVAKIHKTHLPLFLD